MNFQSDHSELSGKEEMLNMEHNSAGFEKSLMDVSFIQVIFENVFNTQWRCFWLLLHSSLYILLTVIVLIIILTEFYNVYYFNMK